jgi:hypothetical protein
MAALSQQNDGAAVQAENADLSLDLIVSNNTRARIAALASKKIHSLPPIRKKKILEIRRQLSKDRYDVDVRLNAALDRLLEEIVAEDSTIDDCLCLKCRSVHKHSRKSDRFPVDYEESCR